MKFAAVLFLAAVATVSAEASKPLTPASFPYNSSGSSDVDCPAFCFAVMRPVYDTNGVQYSNECEMRRAKCQGKEKRKSMEEIYADYKKRYGKLPFGADADSKGSDSSAATGSDCPLVCFDVYDPVHDEQGNTYSNECYMKRAKCKKNEEKTAGNSLRGTTKKEKN